MAIHQLKPRFVATVKVKGMYADGGGLYLQVGDGGKAKSWIFRYHIEGRGDRQMGLGPLHTIGIAEARERARKCREQRLDDIDPIEARNAKRLALRLEAAKQVTFETCVMEWLKVNEPGWRKGTTLNAQIGCRNHLIPILGKHPIAAINVDLAESAIKPIWNTEVGSRVRGYLENILGWAEAKEYRPRGNNPASLEGPLGIRLGKFTHETKHYTFLPYQEIGAFLATLRAVPIHKTERPTDYYNIAEAAAVTGISRWTLLRAIHKGRILATKKAGITTAFFIKPDELHKVYPPKNTADAIDKKNRAVLSYALEFVILTAVRSHQVLCNPTDLDAALRWQEIDWDNKVWNCPPERTKRNKLHEIPLSKRAMEILATIRAQQEADGTVSEYVFVHRRSPHRRRLGVPSLDGKPLYRTSLLKLMKSTLGRRDIMVHGFRRTFSTWAHEDGRFQHNDIEMALGHAPEGNETSRIYNQAKRLEPRRLLMEAWAEHCGRTEPLPAEVVPFRKAK